MKFQSALALCTLVLLNASAVHGALINTSRSNIKNRVSLESGTWCYAVYESGSPKEPTVFVELTTAVNDLCEDSPKTDSLGNDMALRLVHQELHRPDTSYEVAPVSTMRILMSQTSDGSTAQWPSRLMKKGTVKFFNDAKRVYATDPVGNTGSDATYLELPAELEALVDEFSKGASHVIIILRQVQEGKKGLNAVNVKLA